MNQNFELRKLRDFGQIFNDTFAFFKNNIKPLLRSLFVICGIFMLIGTVSTIATYLKMSSAFTTYTLGDSSYIMRQRNASYTMGVFITTINVFITQACINLATLSYISVYQENKGEQPTVAQVWGFFKYYFWRVFFSTILLGLLTIVGAMACLVPGIYLGVVFTLVPSIIVMENESLGYAFNNSFRLIRGRWWSIFGTLFVIGIIISVANGIVGIPLSMTPLISSYLSDHAITIPVVVIFSILRNLLMVTYSIFAIAIALCYFNLSEQKDGTGLMDRIDNFGNAEPGKELPSEEY